MTPSDAPALPGVFAALGDDTRWAILQRLGRAPASASGLAAELPITRQGIAKHLEVLRAAGLVTTERRGREVVHVALGARLTETARALDRLASAWDDRLAEVKALAERVEEDS